MADPAYIIGVIYTLFVLPVLFFQIDPALCWYTSEIMISDLSRSRRFLGRAALSTIVLIPTTVLIVYLKKE